MVSSRDRATKGGFRSNTCGSRSRISAGVSLRSSPPAATASHSASKSFSRYLERLLQIEKRQLAEPIPKLNRLEVHPLVELPVVHRRLVNRLNGAHSEIAPQLLRALLGTLAKPLQLRERVDRASAE